MSGDLRAQLSKKRAERQTKRPEDVLKMHSRLIQNALEEAVFNKKKAKLVEDSPKGKLCKKISKTNCDTKKDSIQYI